MPLALSWSLLVGWSVIRLVQRFADEPRVNSSLLMGATAGYLHIGLTAGLVMGALETIQPGSFAPGDDECRGQQRFGSCPCLLSHQLLRLCMPHHRRIRRHQSNVAAVQNGECGTSIAGRYLAAVMGVLIGRFASSLDNDAKASDDMPTTSVMPGLTSPGITDVWETVKLW